jgi:hypothetical protein
VGPPDGQSNYKIVWSPKPVRAPCNIDLKFLGDAVEEQAFVCTLIALTLCAVLGLLLLARAIERDT